MGRVGVDGRLTGFFSFSLHIGACPGCEEDDDTTTVLELVLLALQIRLHARLFFLSGLLFEHLISAGIAPQNFSSQHTQRQELR